MTNQKINFGEMLLRTAITNSATLATLEVVMKYTEHDLTMDRATGLYSAGTVTLINPNDLGQKECIRFSATAAAATATDSLSRKQYDITVATADDASTKLRGLANDDNGTNSVNNVKSGNMYAFPKNSIVRIAWDSGELQNIYDTFAQNSDEASAVLGEAIAERKAVAIDTADGLLYKFDTTDASHVFAGILKTGQGGAISTTKTYIKPGGTATGFSQTGGKAQYASTSTAGDITETANSFLIGTADNDGSDIAVWRPESPTSFSTTDFDLHDPTDSTKKLVGALSGATTGKTVTMTSSHTDNRSITLPDATDTLLGKATTDVLTNKDLSDSTCNIVDNSDNTKKMAFEVSGVSTATTRTVTMPDANVNLGNIVATPTAVETGTINFGAADTSPTIAHSLGRAPTMIVLEGVGGTVGGYSGIGIGSTLYKLGYNGSSTVPGGASRVYQGSLANETIDFTSISFTSSNFEITVSYGAGITGTGWNVKYILIA